MHLKGSSVREIERAFSEKIEFVRIIQNLNLVGGGYGATLTDDLLFYEPVSALQLFPDYQNKC